MALPPSAPAQDLAQSLARENARNRVALDRLPASPLVDSDRPRMKGLLDDIDSLIKAKRLGAALETLASAAPGVIALERAAGGWARVVGNTSTPSRRNGRRSAAP
jgi:hypothetical protein